MDQFALAIGTPLELLFVALPALTIVIIGVYSRRTQAENA